MVKLLTVKELQAKIAEAEGAKASAALKRHQAEEHEKAELLDRLTKPSGLSDDEVMEKASIIIERAVENGLMSVQVFRFPHTLCSDNGRAINQGETGWETTSPASRRRSSNSGGASSSRAAITSAMRSSTIPVACRAMSASS